MSSIFDKTRVNPPIIGGLHSNQTEWRRVQYLGKLTNLVSMKYYLFLVLDDVLADPEAENSVLQGLTEEVSPVDVDSL